MMGERRVNQEALFYAFSLERHVPADHLVRAIDRFIDLSDLRSRLAPFYSSTGRPSVDPELLKRRAAIAAEFNAAGRLNSGAYLKTVRDALISQFKDALNEMAAFAAMVLPASVAASRVEAHALVLQDDLRQMLNEVLAGKDGSRLPPGNASSELRKTFEAASRSAVATVIEDVRFSLQEKAASRKGLLQFFKRNSVVIGMAIAGGGLVVAFLALLRK